MVQHALAVEIGSDALDFDNVTEYEVILSTCAGLLALQQTTYRKNNNVAGPPSSRDDASILQQDKRTLVRRCRSSTCSALLDLRLLSNIRIRSLYHLGCLEQQSVVVPVFFSTLPIVWAIPLAYDIQIADAPWGNST